MHSRYREPNSGEPRGMHQKMDSMKAKRDLKELAKAWRGATARQRCVMGVLIVMLALLLLVVILVRGAWRILTSIKTWVIIIAISVAYIAYMRMQGGG